MSNPSPPADEWMTAHQAKKAFGIGPHRLKSLALAGRIRTLIDKTRWASCLYATADVRAFAEAEMMNPEGGPRSMVSAGIEAGK